MGNENLYFLKVDLSNNDIEYLKQVASRVKNTTNVGKFDDDFHLTVENSIYSQHRAIRKSLDGWLGMNSQFEFTLNSVNSFISNRAGIIYLTSASDEEKERMSDIHYGIHELIKSNNPDRQNNYRYVPHVTLLREVPIKKVDQLVDIFSQELNPFTINISEITVRETRVDGQQFITRHQLCGC